MLKQPGTFNQIAWAAAMAENEYLDSTKARRWFAVAEAIRDGCDEAELSRRVQDRFYKTLRNISKDLPLAEMLSAVEDPQRLTRICEHIEGGSDVTGLLLGAAFENFGPVNVIQSFLGDALQSCLYDIPYLAAELDGHVNLSDARRKLESVRISLAPDLHRIAARWVENPSWKPQKPRANIAAVPQVDQTRNMLNESLIAGFRK